MGLPERHKKLLTKEGFNELFERELSRFDTHKETFKQLRQESLVIFGQCRYDNYQSFRKSRSKYVKSRQPQ